ncbi:MAG: FadR family transcriptional regulator [Planctomycetota bacterium]|nr:FadR family transcriptional regulator [Planctomycetota bacterium]
MKLRPIVQTSLVDEVAGQLRRLVEDGQMQAGDRLPSEPELLERLRVSRTVLREAVCRLESIGLLKVRRGLGTFVGDRDGLSATAQLIRSAMTISPRDLQQVVEFRRALESPCARNLAARATAEQLAELEKSYRLMNEPGASLVTGMRRDFDFHLKIVELGGNELMRNVLEVLHEFVFAAMLRTLERPGIPKPLHDPHIELFAAIQARDPERAERASHAHMDLVEARLAFAAERPESIEQATQAAAARERSHA